MGEKSQLLGAKENTYGDKYKEHLFEQYKLYVESVEKVSDRRQKANDHFLTMNTALVSFMGVASQLKILENVKWLFAILTLLGVLLCIIFWHLIRSYKQLNSGKFEVIHEIERQLPLTIYRYEWKVLEEGKNPKTYYPFSHIELLVPWIFGLIYFALGAIFIFVI